MKDRIAHIMRAKNLKATDFANLLGIQPSGVSHILAGRNNPSLEFVKKIKESFPEYNLDWIVFGTGPMTTSEPYKEAFKNAQNESQIETTKENNGDNPSAPGVLSFDFDSSPNEIGVDNSAESKQSGHDTAGIAIKSVMVFYEDGTFETFTPR